MLKLHIVCVFAALAVATAALAQTTSPGRLPQQQQPPPQAQSPVRQAPALQQGAPLAGQIPVYIQGLSEPPGTYGQAARSIHATRANMDYDRDGHRAMQFGGDDCDDEDGRVNAAEAEVMDAEGLDEDCNPETLPPLDRDRDGYISWQAMNIIRANDGRPQAVVRGPDCDDGRADVHPGSVEVRGDLRDNDCDGLIDVVDAPGHREYCPPTDHVSAQTLTNPCGQARGDTAQFNRR